MSTSTADGTISAHREKRVVVTLHDVCFGAGCSAEGWMQRIGQKETEADVRAILNYVVVGLIVLVKLGIVHEAKR